MATLAWRWAWADMPASSLPCFLVHLSSLASALVFGWRHRSSRSRPFWIWQQCSPPIHQALAPGSPLVEPTWPPWCRHRMCTTPQSLAILMTLVFSKLKGANARQEKTRCYTDHFWKRSISEECETTRAASYTVCTGAATHHWPLRTTEPKSQEPKGIGHLYKYKFWFTTMHYHFLTSKKTFTPGSPKQDPLNITSMSRGAVAAHVRGNQWAALSSRETGLSGCSLVPGEDGGRPVLPAVTIQHSKHFPILCFLFLYCTTTHTHTSPFRCYKVTLVFHCNTYIYSVFFSHWHPP